MHALDPPPTYTLPVADVSDTDSADSEYSDSEDELFLEENLEGIRGLEDLREEEQARHRLPQARRVVPTMFSAKWEHSRFEGVIKNAEKSGSKSRRIWAANMKKKYNMNTQADLQKMLVKKNQKAATINLSSFQGIASEVREVILEAYFDNIWDGKTPALIVALRPVLNLYFEAIGIFERLNTFRLGRKNDWLSILSPIYKATSYAPFQFMKSISIEVPGLLRREAFNVQMTVEDRLMDVMQTLKTSLRVENLTLEFHSSNKVILTKNLLLIASWALQILKLKVFSLSFTQKSLDIDGLKIGVHLCKLSEHLGIMGHPSMVPSSDTPIIWEWKAEAGEKLAWNPIVEYPNYPKWWRRMWTFDRLDNNLNLLQIGQDAYDDMLRDVVGDEEDVEQYGINVLIPQEVQQSKFKHFKWRIRQAGRRVVYPINKVRHRVVEIKESHKEDQRMKKQKEKKSEHGRVRHIIPDMVLRS